MRSQISNLPRYNDLELRLETEDCLRTSRRAVPVVGTWSQLLDCLLQLCCCVTRSHPVAPLSTAMEVSSVQLMQEIIIIAIRMTSLFEMFETQRSIHTKSCLKVKYLKCYLTLLVRVWKVCERNRREAGDRQPVRAHTWKLWKRW